MAVTQRGKPIVKMTEVNDELEGKERVNYLHWISKAAEAGDDLLVVDEDGDTIWEEAADGLYSSRIHLIGNIIRGLKISVMSSGTLYVIKAPGYPSRYW